MRAVKKTTREILIFGIIGALGTVLDYLVYTTCLFRLHVDVNASKSFAYVVGMVFAYFCNSRWTFAYKDASITSVLRFVLVYVFGMGANVGTNGTVLWCLSAMGDGGETVGMWGIRFAFLTAVGVSATCNFAGMKWFAFRKASEVTDPVQQEKALFSGELICNRATEQQSNRATEQQSNRATEQQSNRATEQQS
ncbi:MAG: GtrA family protein, partial [Burkholderiaceae bacterium]|nr:GtrA family protein [Burkholderiaceae bacterium]